MDGVWFGGAGRSYKPVPHGLLPCPQPVPAPPGSMKRDDVELWRGVLFFFERGLIVLESCDIIVGSPLGRGFLLHFPRGPRPRAPLLKFKMKKEVVNEDERWTGIII